MSSAPPITTINHSDNTTFTKSDWESACRPLKIILGEGWKEIEYDTFKNTDLEEIHLPGSLTTIGSYAFSETPKLEIVEFTRYSKLTDIGYASFRSATKLKTITIPSGVISIIETFAYATNLKKVQFKPDSSLKQIGMNAFYKTNIKEIYLPKDVNYIENNAFDGIDSLTVHITPNTLVKINEINSSLQRDSLEEDDYVPITFGHTALFGATNVTIMEVAQEGGRKLRTKTKKEIQKTKK
jgi:hypothetical protein